MSTLPLTIQTSDESSLPPRASESRSTLLPDMTTAEKLEHHLGPIFQMFGRAMLVLMLPALIYVGNYVGGSIISIEKTMAVINFRLDAMQSVMIEQSATRYSTRDATQDAEILKLKLTAVTERLDRLERAPVAAARSMVSTPARAAITR